MEAVMKRYANFPRSELRWPIGGALLIYAIDCRSWFLLNTFSVLPFHIGESSHSSSSEHGTARPNDLPSLEFSELVAFCQNSPYKDEVHSGNDEKVLSEVFNNVAYLVHDLKSTIFSNRTWAWPILDRINEVCRQRLRDKYIRSFTVDDRLK
ncbi:uncharacterized protein K452DRAFT_69736 [Aplosporella prunicola CBS 121167]|uniref:Uncharacterized protein n=1 Tax=Aplosporella prunicola CBS 121167 TaxID=1176127 RepID=A0A6A6BU24_9PEZI|nr:uncharacterized protein K452DRAFT_69736 [Aplosporella prunicola CBS 121167]KAF2146714.1 hypothetical protein K452DRAFT_69736 [Aplosporella prunicola CBS 121167]